MKMAWSSALTIFLVSISATEGLIKNKKGLPISFGRCPRKLLDRAAKKTLDRDQFLGGWYLQSAIPVPLLQPDGVSCVFSIYGEDGSGSSMHDWTIMTSPKGNVFEFCGKFKIPNPKTSPSKFLSTFPGVPVNNDYFILDTDYSSFYSGYACVDLPFPLLAMKMELGWAFTRTPNPDKDTFEAAMDVFTKNGISIDNFRRVPHSPDCVHLFEDTCLKRDYPRNKFEDLLYFARYQTENLVRKFLNLFGLNQVEKRPVPDDTVNFYLDQTRKRENA